MNSSEIIANYRAALRRSIGAEREAASRVSYASGWFYINMARQYPDGSIGTIGHASSYRAKQVIQMTENLIRQNKP